MRTYAQLVQYFSEKPMAQHLCMGGILYFTFLLYFTKCVTDGVINRFHASGLILFILLLFREIRQWSYVYVDQF